MSVKFANNAKTTLNAGISAAAVSAALASAASFPALAAGDYFFATISTGPGAVEIVKVTALAGNDATIERAQEGTAAQAWPQGAAFELRFTSGSFAAALAEKAAVDHNHNGVYATIGHNHNGIYALIGHNHDGVYAPAAHTHVIADVTGLQAALDSAANGKAALSGATFTGKVNIPQSDGTSAFLNIGATAASNPTAPQDGDLWIAGNALTYRTASGTRTAMPTLGGSFSGKVTFKAGTAGASGNPFSFQAGVLLTAPSAHAVEWDGTAMYLTNAASVRKTVAFAEDVTANYQPKDQQLTDLAGLVYAGNEGKAVKVKADGSGFELGDVAAQITLQQAFYVEATGTGAAQDIVVPTGLAAQDVEVYVNGMRQKHTTHYTYTPATGKVNLTAPVGANIICSNPGGATGPKGDQGNDGYQPKTFAQITSFAIVAADSGKTFDATGMAAAITYALPAASSVPAGFHFTVRNGTYNASTIRYVTLARAGADTIDGAAANLNVYNETVIVRRNAAGDGWIVQKESQVNCWEWTTTAAATTLDITEPFTDPQFAAYRIILDWQNGTTGSQGLRLAIQQGGAWTVNNNHNSNFMRASGGVVDSSSYNSVSTMALTILVAASERVRVDMTLFGARSTAAGLNGISAQWDAQSATPATFRGSGYLSTGGALSMLRFLGENNYSLPAGQVIRIIGIRKAV